MPIYKQDLHFKEKSVRSFKEIFTDIQFNQTIQTLVENIRSSSESCKDIVKKQLPVFYPTVENEINGVFIPSGIVQIDIDLKSNTSLDVESFKQKIIEVPYCYFAFTSPNGGVKLGIRTDFTNVPNHNNEQTAIRYKKAYEHVIEYLLDLPNIPDFIQDDCVKSLSQACFLSHDLAPHLNESAEILTINEYCIFPSSQTFSNNPNNQHDQSNLDYVRELLSYIPNSLSYHDRLRVNYSVFSCLDTNTAYSLLVNHWHSNPKVNKQLDDISTHLKFGSIGQLVNIAKEYDYKPKTGKSRKSIKPKVSDQVLEPLLTREEGFARVKQLVAKFFCDKQSSFINASVGLGKTQATIEEITSLPNSIKILYLVKSYELAYQIERDINETVKKRLKGVSFESRAKRKHTVKIIKGRAQPFLKELSSNGFLMCNHRQEINGLEISFATQSYVSKKTCLKECPLINQCAYIEQFNSTANIRLSTHDSYFNKPSKWISGSKLENVQNHIYEDEEHGFIEVETFETVDGDCEWKPDFIIVDEDIIKTEKHIESAQSRYDSIRSIIKDLGNRVPLAKSIEDHSFMIHEDNASNHQYPLINYKNIEQYYKELSNIKSRFEYSLILDTFAKYLDTLDSSLLDGFSFDNDQLIYRFIVEKAESLGNTPVLYLDATANEKVVRAAYGNIEFHKVAVRGHQENNIYQLSNGCISKKSLSDKVKLENVLIGLKKISSTYKKVGLITYKTVSNELVDGEEFPKWMAERIGADIYAHFGGLRGLNKFEDVDCLLVVGRYSLNPFNTQDITKCLFGEGDYPIDRAYRRHQVRMKDGSVMSVEAQAPQNEIFNAVYEHKSQSETIQAIGRARFIHSGGKDIYIFSNESIGTDIEVTDFFEWDDYFNLDVNSVNESTISKLQKLGFVENSHSGITKALQDVGFEVNIDLEYYVKKNQEMLVKILLSSSFNLYRYSVKNHNHQHTKPKDFFVFGNDIKLKNHYSNSLKKTLSLIE